MERAYDLNERCTIIRHNYNNPSAMQKSHCLKATRVEMKLVMIELRMSPGRREGETGAGGVLLFFCIVLLQIPKVHKNPSAFHYVLCMVHGVNRGLNVALLHFLKLKKTPS